MAGSVGEGEFGFQIAPMQKHEAYLTTQLPGQGSGSSVPVEIGIDEDGQVTVAGAPYDTPTDHALPQLVDHLKGVVSANDAQPVVVTPTRSTKHQRVIDVLNACASARVKNLAFGTPAD
jgi:biopolymer transport protein ExbD